MFPSIGAEGNSGLITVNIMEPSESLPGVVKTVKGPAARAVRIL